MENSSEKLKLPELEAIALRLKELRKLKGYSNYEHIAFELGMSRSAYWSLETCANFELKTLVKICRLLEISLEDFFKGINIPSSKKGYVMGFEKTPLTFYNHKTLTSLQGFQI